MGHDTPRRTPVHAHPHAQHNHERSVYCAPPSSISHAITCKGVAAFRAIKPARRVTKHAVLYPPLAQRTQYSSYQMGEEGSLSVLSVEITLDEAPHVLESLAQWLKLEDDLRGRVHPKTSQIEPGEMGGVLQIIAVAVSSGGAISILVQSLFAWLSTRKSGQIHLRLTREDGREAELTFNGAHNLDAVTEKLLRFVNNGEKSA